MSKKQKRKKQGQEGRNAEAKQPAAETTLASAVLVSANAGEPAASEVIAQLIPPAPPSSPEPITHDDDDHDRHAAEMAPAVAFHAAPHVDAQRETASRLVAGYDIDADAEHDVAPVGPTELGMSPPSIPPAALQAANEQAAAPNVDEIEQQIRDLEAKLDLMIGRGRSDKPPPPIPPVVISAGAPPAEPSEPPADEDVEETDEATASEVLSPDFVARKWGRTALRSRSEEVDDFGLDPAFEAKIQPIVDFLQKYYFRVDAKGTEHIPSEGRCLLVANHAGGPLPYDGAMLRAAIRRKHPAHRELRWLTEDFVYYLPFVGTLMNRLGAVRACQENAERLLGKEALVAVFPEGAKGIGKLYRDRYRLQRFGRGGFIRLCLRTRTPLVPCAIVGAEEANPMLYRIEYMTKSLGIPYFPITPTFPALGALGLMPAPTKWKIQFGEPLTWSGYGPEAADDEILVGRLSERVRASIQSMLDRMLAERRSVWLG